MKPKIRFNNTCWQKHKVGDLCDLLTGYPFPGDKILNRGKNLLMRGINITEGRIRHSDEIDRYYNEDIIGLEKYRLQVGDLVIGMDGSKVGKNSALVTSKENNSLLVQRVARLRNEDKNLINLIQIAVGSDKFIKYVEEMKTSSAIPHISPADIRNFPLSLPEDSNERRLIASYFTSLDSQISASTSRLASLKQMKAASLQAMFPQEGETVPKVRFKGFEGEWPWLKLGDISEQVKRKAPINSTAPVMMISALNGFINQSEKYSDNNAGSSLANYTLLKKGELSYNHGYSKTRNFGSCFNLLVEEARIPFVYHSFRLLDDNDLFYAYYLNSGAKDKELKRLVSSTARMDGLLNISFKDYMELSVPHPSKAEQQAIANYFTSLDHQITLQTHRLEKLKQIKSACLDKMFV